MGLRDKGSSGRAFHHHHSALQSIAEDDRWRQRKFGPGLAPLGVTVARSRLDGVELVDDGGGIAVIFGGGQDAEVAVVCLENGDADHEGGGEVYRHQPGTTAGSRRCSEMRRRVDFRSFGSNVPMAEMATTGCLRSRHWTAQFDPEPSFSSIAFNG